MFLGKSIYSLPVFSLFLTAPALAQSPSAPAVDWNGPYVGVSLGVSKALADPTAGDVGTSYFFMTDHPQIDPQISQDLEATLFNASFSGGINRQYGNAVLGLEGDFMMNDFDEQYTSGNMTYETNSTQYFITSKVNSKWIASLRPRVGYAQDSSLFYLSAGPALTKFEYDFQFSDNYGPQSVNMKSDKIKLGWAASLGIEHKFQETWALKAEYLFTNFTNVAKKNTTLTTVATDGFDNKVSYITNNIRIGLVKSF